MCVWQVETLEDKRNFNALKIVYCAVNDKAHDDTEMLRFFKMKG